MAAVSGILFAVLLVVALVLVETGPKLDDPDSRYTSFYTNGSGGTLVTLGVYVVPFAGIAFLWHVVATRTLLQVLAPVHGRIRRTGSNSHPAWCSSACCSAHPRRWARWRC